MKAPLKILHNHLPDNLSMGRNQDLINSISDDSLILYCQYKVEMLPGPAG